MNTNGSIKPKFADLADAGPSRGFKPRTLRGWIQDGLLTAYRPNGGKLLVDLDELDAFIRSRRYDPKTRLNGRRC